ncbi:C3H1-type domain-containing protein [Plasmodiophora brassicae]|uniref:C3H1-type domain-containing protein n=2 Tax=Plasmodiophora brassicae TaxID=37360 RepID=A0A3P3YB87_PLABS|nr:unnamed protein product [Plasmodiophora brassicae]
MASFGAPSKAPLMDEAKLIKYKTVMCQRMVRAGQCRYGNLCDFAHSAKELRRNLNQHWYQGVMCEIPDHDDKKCEYAHNEMELVYHPSVYKTKLCDKFASPDGCSKNQYCANAHGKHDLRQGKPLGPRPVATSGYAATGRSPSPNPSPHANARRDFDGNHGFAGSKPQQQGDIGGPVAAQRHQSFSNYNDPSAAHMAMTGFHEFQETTNDLKIRILDLVDQISQMHAERAAYEQNHNASQMVQDAYKSSREQVAQLRQQLDNAKLTIQAQQGNPSALARLSPAALQQLARKTSQAAAAIAAYKPSGSPKHNLISDLSELHIS